MVREDGITGESDVFDLWQGFDLAHGRGATPYPFRMDVQGRAGKRTM
jgi:hypothetical protein